MDSQHEFIDSKVELDAVCRQLRQEPWLAIDTEFERTNTYYPELCLLQIAGTERVVMIDPLAVTDLTVLYELLYDTAITKVFHSARQDLEIFHHALGKVPMPVFDTQIAAALLGHNDQTGYANIIQSVLGVELDKSQTRTNWKRRPLSDKQLRYAADDVIYLRRLYEVLLQELQVNGLLDQAQADCHALDNPLWYEPDPASMWQKIKAARYLQGEALVLLKKLAAWRERTARTENKPRKWILSDPALVTIARQTPVDNQALLQVKGIGKPTVKRHGRAILDLVHAAGASDLN